MTKNENVGKMGCVKVQDASPTTGAAWVIMLLGRVVDIVWYAKGLTARQVREDLLYTHGFDAAIQVMRPC